MEIIRKNSILVIALLQFQVLAPASTGVGHGDVLDQFVTTTRGVLVTVLKEMRAETHSGDWCDCSPDEEKTPACQLLRTLTTPQKDFCGQFLQTTKEQMLRLNEGEHPTPLKLQPKPILADDPTGASRPVAAMTELRPEGPIILHYGSVQLMSPPLMLQLLGHEFGHKVRWDQLPGHVEDNSSTGPFVNPEGGGRMLLDSVGAAIAHYAFQHKLIGESFGLQDLFACEIHESNSNLTFSSTQRSYRAFKANTLFAYETGIGSSPEEDYCEIREGKAARLYFRVKVHEENGCYRSSGVENRWTLLELWEIPTGETLPVKVNSRLMIGLNPLCSDPGRVPVGLSYEKNNRKYQFQLTYQGSVVKHGFRTSLSN
jgi:hypothetical protein